MFVLATGIGLSGIRPLQLVDISIIFGMLIMPITYYPILRTAADKNIMGEHVNNKLVTILASLILLLIVIAALAAIPLMVLTHVGRP
jgi:Mn2+/Fe2+ NRAMP family transporter